MKKLNLLLLLVFLYNTVISAPDSLVFTVQKNVPYQYLTTPTTITTTDWDDFDADVPLGFTYRMMHDTTSHIYFDQNDGVGAEMFFKTSLMQNNYSFISWIADVYDLHNDFSNLNSSINYKTEVVSGKKITKIEWRNVGFFDLGTTDSANLQAWFHEDKNVFELRFGKSSRAAITALYKDSINGYGTKGPFFAFVQNYNYNADSFDKLYYVKNENPAIMDSATTSQINNALSTIGVDSFPVENTLYRWSPAISAGNNAVFLNSNIKLYPTVVQRELFIEQKENNNYQLYVVNSQGAIVAKQTLTTSNMRIDLSALTAGSYRVILSNNNERISYAILKE